VPALRPLFLAGIVLLAACARPSPPAPRSTAAGAPLLASLQASTFGSDSVRFTLQVTNTGETPMTLSFASGQSYDFVVSREGRQVWRWSAERVFTQALRSETLGAGETRTFSEVWTPATRSPGRYAVRGTLTARDARAEQTTDFTL
jgi:hypothetical protein